MVSVSFVFWKLQTKKEITLLKQAAEEKNVVSISCMSTVAQRGNQSKSSRYEKFPDLTLQQKKSDGKGWTEWLALDNNEKTFRSFIRNIFYLVIESNE